jgi:hypothetical protein
MCYVLQGVRNLAEVLETDSVDLYENILKPMVKVGQDFVSAVSTLLLNDENGKLRNKGSYI